MPGSSDEEDDRKMPAIPNNANQSLGSSSTTRTGSMGRVVAPPASAGKTAPRKRKQASKKKRLSDKPTRPLSSYNLFFRDERLKILAERAAGDTSLEAASVPTEDGGKKQTFFATMGKTIAKRWRELSQSDRARYEELATEEMQRYCCDLAEYEKKERQKDMQSMLNEPLFSLPAPASSRAAYPGMLGDSSVLQQQSSVATVLGRDPSGPSTLAQDYLRARLQDTAHAAVEKPSDHPKNLAELLASVGGGASSRGAALGAFQRQQSLGRASPPGGSPHSAEDEQIRQRVVQETLQEAMRRIHRRQQTNVLVAGTMQQPEPLTAERHMSLFASPGLASPSSQSQSTTSQPAVNASPSSLPDLLSGLGSAVARQPSVAGSGLANQLEHLAMERALLQHPTQHGTSLSSMILDQQSRQTQQLPMAPPQLSSNEAMLRNLVQGRYRELASAQQPQIPTTSVQGLLQSPATSSLASTQEQIASLLAQRSQLDQRLLQEQTRRSSYGFASQPAPASYSREVLRQLVGRQAIPGSATSNPSMANLGATAHASGHNPLLTSQLFEAFLQDQQQQSQSESSHSDRSSQQGGGSNLSNQPRFPPR